MIFALLISLPPLAVMLWITVSLYILRKRRSSLNENRISVSVIIPARNEAALIRETLEGIIRQDHPSELTEIIVVDDASDDGTGAIIEDFRNSYPERKFRIISRSVAGKKDAVEEAAGIASGELIITTDADCNHPVTWISSIVSLYSEKRPEMITGPVVFSDHHSFFSELLYLEFAGLMGATAGSASGGYPLMCNGANLAFTKKAFLEAGGFSGNKKYASGDDQFLMMKLVKIYDRRSVRFNFDDAAIVRTAPPATFGEFCRQRLRWVSKNKGYKDIFVTAVAVFTWLINAFILAGAFFPGIRNTFFIILASKFITDLAVTAMMSAFFRRTRPLLLFPLAFILNSVYVVVIGVAGMFISYRWKGIRRN